MNKVHIASYSYLKTFQFHSVMCNSIELGIHEKVIWYSSGYIQVIKIALSNCLFSISCLKVMISRLFKPVWKTSGEYSVDRPLCQRKV